MADHYEVYRTKATNLLSFVSESILLTKFLNARSIACFCRDLIHP